MNTECTDVTIRPPSLIKMRPYQETCIMRVLAAYHKQPQGGKALIVLPTGGGKTIVFTELARRLGLTTLIIAHRQELLHQAADKFRLVDPTAIVGQVGAGLHEYGAPITVASIQTLSRPEHLEKLQQFGYGLVIIDECHHSAASGYQAVLNALPHAFVLGVTATPDRLDNQSIERIFGEPLYEASIIDMVEKGYLCDLRAIAVHTATSLDALHTQAGDFKQDELEEVIDTPERNRRVVNAYLEHCQGRQALCFAVTVDHAFHLMQAFLSVGVAAGMVSGETPAKERIATLKAYERGEITVLCNCGVLTEGYDCPETSCIIMARPTQSRSLYVQCVGRGTRPAPGKENCIILDITDNCLKHRLQPQALSKALAIPLLEGESILEGKLRTKQEDEERDKRERLTKVSKRVEDLAVDVLARLDWKRQRNGGYILEVGPLKHRILLNPSEEMVGYYSVWAKLAPSFTLQPWMKKEAPLGWAQQYAERQARTILADPQKVKFLDRTAPWRCLPVEIESKQAYHLRRFGVNITDDMTKGEAADLLDELFAQERAEREQRRTEKKEKTSKTSKRGKSTNQRKRAKVSA